MGDIKDKQDQHHLKKTIDNLRDVKIIHTNYKQYTDIVRNKCEIIETQIQSMMARYTAVITELQRKEEAFFKIESEPGAYPPELYKLRKDLNTVTEDLVIWKGIEEEMLEIMFYKLTGALASVKSLDIEREVTKGLKEMNVAYFGFMKEFVIDKNNQMEKKIEAFQKQMLDRFDTLTHKMMALVASKIIEAQRNDGKVSITAKEMNDINKIGEAKETIETPKIEKIKVKEQLIINDDDKGDIGMLKCEECEDVYENEKQLNAHMMLMHKQSGGDKQ